MNCVINRCGHNASVVVTILLLQVVCSTAAMLAQCTLTDNNIVVTRVK